VCVLIIIFVVTARWPIGRDFIIVAYKCIKKEMEERFLGLLVDSLGHIIRPKLIYYVNTIYIEIVLVYELWNIYFFNW
jgi:hypothetical protein